MSLPKTFFASPTVHARTVKLADGSEHVLHFRELPALEFRRYAESLRSEDQTTRLDALPRLIVAALCEEEGKDALNLAQARTLKGAPMQAIYDAIVDVNRATPEAAKSEGNA